MACGDLKPVRFESGSLGAGQKAEGATPSYGFHQTGYSDT